MRHFISAAALAATLLAACSESSTAPEATAPESTAPEPGAAPSPAPSFAAGLPGTNVSISSGSCTQISTTTGEVHCSYSISNPDQLLINIYPEAHMAIDYQCLNASTGKVQSTGTGYRWAWLYFEGVTDANPSGVDVKLGSTTLPNSYKGKYQKSNTCKRSQKLVITKYTMVHWDIYVDNYYVGQPYEQYADVCYSDDADYGCTQ
jgi:hypothetical protein